MTQPITVTRKTKWTEFKAYSLTATKTINKILGTSTTPEKVRNNLLRRFAEKEGLTVKQAKSILKANG